MPRIVSVYSLYAPQGSTLRDLVSERVFERFGDASTCADYLRRLGFDYAITRAHATADYSVLYSFEAGPAMRILWDLQSPKTGFLARAALRRTPAGRAAVALRMVG